MAELWLVNGGDISSPPTGRLSVQQSKQEFNLPHCRVALAVVGAQSFVRFEGYELKLTHHLLSIYIYI